MVTDEGERSVADMLDERTATERTKGRPPSLKQDEELEIVKEFLLTGASLRQIAARRGHTLGVCRRAVRRVKERVGEQSFDEFLKGTQQ